MADKNRRKGQRKPRSQHSKKRVPNLGYYYIITDAKETEKNYLYGLRDAIPEELKGRLVIKVSKTSTENLVDEADSLANLAPQYSQHWIVFDRDRIKNFDEIIAQAKQKNICVGWSNPCIEIWFSAYFGTMPTYHDSVACCKGFEKTFEKFAKQEYKKSDSKIFEKLSLFGDQKQAIRIAKQKLREKREGCNKPSDMCPATTLHLLVDEIIQIIDREKNC